VEDCELAISFGERIALAPAAGRAERKLTSVPAELAAAAQGIRLELPDDLARCVDGPDTPRPEAATREPPAASVGLRGPGAGEEPSERSVPTPFNA
jgi:hypothetical protein